jgi:hypothetical protein
MSGQPQSTGGGSSEGGSFGDGGRFFFIRTRQRQREDRALLQNFRFSDYQEDQFIFYRLFLKPFDLPLGDRDDTFRVVSEGQTNPSWLDLVNEIAETRDGGAGEEEYMDVMYIPFQPHRLVHLGF